MNFVAGFLYMAGTLASAAAPQGDQARAFEKALKATPEVKNAPAADPRFQPRPVSVADLQIMLQRGDPEASIEQIATQLIASHPSAAVQRTGTAFIDSLEERRQYRAQSLAAKANTALDQARIAVTHAQKAADLDAILTTLTHLTNPASQAYAFDPGSQQLFNQLSLAQQFVSAWQSYLSASAAGRTDEARQSLERLLDSPQFDSLDYFRRSKLLALRDGGPSAAASLKTPAEQADDILEQVKSFDDLSTALNKIALIPNQPMDFAGIRVLQQAIYDAGAGLPVTLDIEGAMTNNYYGDNFSRITAIEFLALLPYYFDTQDSDPPKKGETLNVYLDRLATTTDNADNLALLQRVLATKIAVTRGHPIVFGTPPAIFLAGLSQEAAGQYAPAVVSYEKSLQDFDPLVPVQLVGHRLAAIKAAHPDEFSQGMTTFLTPPEPSRDPRFPFGYPPRPYMPFPPQYATVAALPISMTISIPAHAPAKTAPPANSPTDTSR